MNLKLTVLTASMLGASTTSALAPAAPAFAAAFANEPNAALWSRMVVTMPALAVVLSAAAVGILTDRVGRKPVLIGSIVLFIVAGTAGLWAPDLITLLIGRAVLGVAVAGLLTSITAILGDRFSGRERARLIGLQSGAIGFASVTFTLLGGFLADQSWRAPFAVYGAALLVIPMALTLAPDPAVLPFSAEAPREEPPIDARIRRLLAGVFVGIFAIQIAFVSAALQLPFQLNELTGGTTAAGLAVASMGVAFAITSIVVQRVAWSLAPLGRTGLGFVGVGVGMGLLSTLNPVPLGIGLVTAGIGFGIIQPTLVVALNQGVPNALRGRASGGFTMALFLGQFVAPLIAQPVADWVGISGSFVVFGAVFGVIALAIWLVHARTRVLGPAA